MTREEVYLELYSLDSSFDAGKSGIMFMGPHDHVETLAVLITKHEAYVAIALITVDKHRPVIVHFTEIGLG
jgi:hypothetical protein